MQVPLSVHFEFLEFLHICRHRNIFQRTLRDPFSTVGDDADAAKVLKDDVLRRVRRIGEAELRPPLEAEIVIRLMDGRRTAPELTGEIFGNHEEYRTEYARIRRELKRLESKGVVAATTLFGRKRPYRITRYGVARLMQVNGTKEESFVNPTDAFLYIATIAVLALVLDLPEAPSGLPLVLAFLSGGSIVRLLESLRSVW